jgi:hypothetical protein
MGGSSAGGSLAPVIALHVICYTVVVRTDHRYARYLSVHNSARYHSTVLYMLKYIDRVLQCRHNSQASNAVQYIT